MFGVICIWCGVSRRNGMIPSSGSRFPGSMVCSLAAMGACFDARFLRTEDISQPCLSISAISSSEVRTSQPPASFIGLKPNSLMKQHILLIMCCFFWLFMSGRGAIYRERAMACALAVRSGSTEKRMGVTGRLNCKSGQPLCLLTRSGTTFSAPPSADSVRPAPDPEQNRLFLT